MSVLSIVGVNVLPATLHGDSIGGTKWPDSIRSPSPLPPKGTVLTQHIFSSSCCGCAIPFAIHCNK